MTPIGQNNGRYRSLSPQGRRGTFRKKSRVPVSICAVLVIALIIGVRGLVRRHFAPESTTAKDNQLIPAGSLATNSTSGKTLANKEIQTPLQDIVDLHPELVMGISFTDLKTGMHVDIDGDKPFSAASTTKLVTATYFLSQVEAGNHTLTEPLGIATAEYQLEQMVNQSNNDSWILFLDLLGRANIQAYAESLGLKTYDYAANSFSANDMTTLLSLLYNGKILNKADRELLFSYMQDTNDDTLISGALSADITVYHKYGELEDNVHDGAIIEDGDTAYALAVYTNGKGYYNYDERTQTIHDIVTAIQKALHGKS